MITNYYSIIMAFAAGFLTGILYFAGLWWTVRRLPGRTRPGLWLVCSGLVRGGAVLTVFYFIMGGGGANLLAALGGFLAARITSVRRVGPSGDLLPRGRLPERTK